MKQTISLILVGLVFLMPIALAEASAQAEAKSVSVLDLRFKQVGEAFSDFTFKIKAALAFDNEAKLDLINERNADLKARQEAWVGIKQDAMASFNGNMTSRQKQNIIAVLQAEHEAIIEDRLELNEEIREVQLDAKAENNAELEAGAETAAESMENGLLGIFIGLDTGAEFESDARLDTKVESEAEAKAVVKSKLGLEGDEVQTAVKSGATFYVVSGQETETSNGFALTKSFYVWVDANSGLIMAADMDVHIESTGNAQANASKTVSRPKGILDIGISSKSNIEGSSGTGGSSTSSGSAGAGSQSSGSVSAGASGGASGSAGGASAGASGSVEVSVN